MSIRSKIVRDAFTERLLEVWEALVKLGAIDYKKTFTNAIELNLTEFYQIEKHIRNYPLDDGKRSLALLNLKEKYFVNPGFMSGSSKTMFFRDPIVAKRQTGGGKVITITSVSEVKQYQERIKALEARVIELESLLGMIAEDPMKYEKQIKKVLKNRIEE